MEKEKSLQRVSYIDALRGIACVMVIFTHIRLFLTFSSMAGGSGFLYKIAGEGARGVQLFYILSALTLYMSLYKQDYSGKVMESIKYFLRRFFRIAPLFYTMIIV